MINDKTNPKCWDHGDTARHSETGQELLITEISDTYLIVQELRDGKKHREPFSTEGQLDPMLKEPQWQIHRFPLTSLIDRELYRFGAWLPEFPSEKFEKDASISAADLLEAGYTHIAKAGIQVPLAVGEIYTGNFLMVSKHDHYAELKKAWTKAAFIGVSEYYRHFVKPMQAARYLYPHWWDDDGNFVDLGSFIVDLGFYDTAKAKHREMVFKLASDTGRESVRKFLAKYGSESKTKPHGKSGIIPSAR